MSIQTEQRLWDALKRITAYMPPSKLERVCEKKYGLERDEAIEMAYENVLAEATQAIKGIRRPKDKPVRAAAESASKGTNNYSGRLGAGKEER